MHRLGGALDPQLHPEDEEEELVPRRRVFMGMKFHDEESQTTAKKVCIASLVLAGFVFLHFILATLQSGNFMHHVVHLIFALALPLIGYRGATLEEDALWRPRLVWIYHIGNVLLLIVHCLMVLIVFSAVSEVQHASVESMCNQNALDDPMLPPAGADSRVLPTLPPDGESYADCQARVLAEKANAPGLAGLWALFSLPYFLCLGYAAYHSHDLYFQIRIRELAVRRGVAEGADPNESGIATVGWGEASSIAVE